MNDSRFAWSADKRCFYYINDFSKAYYTVYESKEPEVYNFLMNVYCVNAFHIKDVLETYQEVKEMRDMSYL